MFNTYSEFKLRHNQIGRWDAEDILLTKSFCVKIETDFERFFLILHVIFLFFPVSGSFFCRFARAPHHENSLNLRWDWRTVLCRGQFMHFQSTSNEWKKNLSRCFQQIGFCLFLAFIWIFQLLNRLNSKSSKLVILVFPKTNVKGRTLRSFSLFVFLSLHQPLTKNQIPNFFVLIFVAIKKIQVPRLSFF